MSTKSNISNEQEGVLSFNTAREEKIEAKRREYERVLFKNVLGVYSVIENKKLYAVELIDISENGLSFHISKQSSLEFSIGDQLNLRCYFSPDSFIPIAVNIVRIMDKIQDGSTVTQYGCEIDKSLKSYEAVFHLFKFISSCAEHGHQDNEHLKIFF